MLSEHGQEGQATSSCGDTPRCDRARPRIALISNPRSTGNVALLPRIRAFCAAHDEIFHYEVEHVDQIGAALKSIARIKPRLLVINGGDGTVQATLTELHNGSHFADGARPPVAVLPSGKTNLIAMDLGAAGDPVAALAKLLDLARGDLESHLVARKLIALSQDDAGGRSAKPVVGMFLGGAGLADIMLYCRNRIYPLGLPNAVSHVLAALAVIARQLFGLKASFLPPDPAPLSLSVARADAVRARFSLLFVTTLDKLLLSGTAGEGAERGAMKLVAVEQRAPLMRAFLASLSGKLGRTKLRGVHVEQTDEILIEGEDAPSDVILDGEMFRAEAGRPIRLSAAAPLSFVRLAA